MFDPNPFSNIVHRLGWIRDKDFAVIIWSQRETAVLEHGIGTAFAQSCVEQLLGEFMNQEILDNPQLAERWKLIGTPDAIAKRFQRLRALPKSNPRHLKAFKIGNQTRYRLSDILEYEDRNARRARRAFRHEFAT